MWLSSICNIKYNAFQMSWMSSQERLRVSSNSSLNAVVPQGFFWEHASRWYIRSSASTACWELYVLKRLLLSQTKLCRLCPFLMPGAVRGGCGVTWPHVLTLTPALQETCMSKIIYAYNKASWDKYKYDDPHGFWGGGGGDKSSVDHCTHLHFSGIFIWEMYHILLVYY